MFYNNAFYLELLDISKANCCHCNKIMTLGSFSRIQSNNSASLSAIINHQEHNATSLLSLTTNIDLRDSNVISLLSLLTNINRQELSVISLLSVITTIDRQEPSVTSLLSVPSTIDRQEALILFLLDFSIWSILEGKVCATPHLSLYFLEATRNYSEHFKKVYFYHIFTAIGNCLYKYSEHPSLHCD